MRGGTHSHRHVARVEATSPRGDRTKWWARFASSRPSLPTPFITRPKRSTLCALHLELTSCAVRLLRLSQVHLSKPTWVSHESQPIFSVDVHPDGTRFATAGNDHRIKLWSLKPCMDEAAEHDASVPRLLATLSGHEGSVNCARWSPDGRLLASGSDDQLVMLWRLAAPGERLGAMPFGSAGPANIEKWRCVATLRGHNGDVVGVAWSPDARRVASVSLDNSVRVWDASGDGDGSSLLKVLEGHLGMVKGVAWDPIGRYIASQGDDRSAILWDARDWKEAARVDEPFQVHRLLRVARCALVLISARFIRACSISARSRYIYVHARPADMSHLSSALTSNPACPLALLPARACPCHAAHVAEDALPPAGLVA